MTQSSELQNITSLALHLGYTKANLLALLYGGGISYRTFSIPKKDGTKRIIHAPRRALNAIQRKLAILLTKDFKPKRSVHGFVKSRGIATNARNHCGKSVIINVDIKDFFHSITFARVYGALKSNPYIIPNEVAAVVAHACCHEEHLPMGSPCSPILSNIIASHLDTRLLKIAAKYGLYYSRYADDITFSSKNSRVTSQLISFDPSSSQWSGEIIDAIHSAGFDVNPSKIRIQRRHQRQEVTGLTVNAFPNKKRSYIDKIRGALKSWESYGHDSANDHYNALKGTDNASIAEYINGCLAHLCDIRGRNDPIFCKLMTRYSKLVGQEYRCYEIALEQLLDSLLIVYNCKKEEIGTAFLLFGYGIVTCSHVAEDASFVSHWEEQKRTHLASIKKSLELHDISILDVPTFPSNKHIHIRSSDNLLDRSGAKYYFAGFPNYNGVDHPNVYTGRIINSTKFFGLDYYKLDKDVYGGASGAPLVDNNFRAIGIVVRGLGSDFKPGDTDANLAINLKYLREII